MRKEVLKITGNGAAARQAATRLAGERTIQF
jgi:hypothetical protein